MKKITSLLFLIPTIVLYGQINLISPTNNSVFDQSTINFEWNEIPDAISYQVQIALDGSFFETLINKNELTNTFYSTDNLEANRRYYWRVKANNSIWSPIYSFRIVDFRTWPEIELILDPDSVIVDIDGKVQQWTDLSGNNKHFIQIDNNQRPTIIIDSTINNQNVISFNPTLKNYLEGPNLSNLTQGEIYTLVKKNRTPAINAQSAGLWRFGTDSQGDFYPYTDDYITFSFGRNTRYIVGYSANIGNLLENHIVNCVSGTNGFKYFLNGIEKYTTSVGGVAFTNDAKLGQSVRGTILYYMDGTLGTTLIFNTVLSDSLRDLTHEYLRHKYAPPVHLGNNISLQNLCDTTLYAQKYFQTYLWSDGSTNDHITVTEPGSYWVKVTDIFGNISRDTIEVLAKLHYPKNTGICQDKQITWKPSEEESYTYLWSDGSTNNNLIISEPGDYFVTVTDTNSCSYTSPILSFTIDSFPSRKILGADKDLCFGNKITLEDTTNIVSYQWDTGENTPTIFPKESRKYSVIATNSGGCIAKDTITINILGDAPILEVTTSSYTCENQEVNFFDDSYTLDGALINSWHWELGDGNTANGKEITHTYQENGFYAVTLKIGTSSGCFNDTTFQMEVKTNPSLSFTSQGLCQNDEILFYGNQFTPTILQNWQWDFGDGKQASGQDINHTYKTSEDFTIRLIGEDIFGCIDTVIQTKKIAPLPETSFTFEPICEGGVVYFQNNTQISPSGSISTYQWNFGDGTSSGNKNPQKPYPLYGEYAITLKATSNEGCSSDSTQNLKVHAIPSVNFETEQTCAKIGTIFNDKSFIPNGSVAEVQWAFNGLFPETGLSIVKEFDYPGIYQVKQSVQSAFGCNNSKEQFIEISPEIKSDFEMSPSALLVEQPILFTSKSIGADQYFWTFGDFATSTKPDTNIFLTEEKIGEEYEISLSIRNKDGSCSDVKTIVLPVLGRETDLALTELFFNEINGFLQVAVRLKNEGIAPIEKVELLLYIAGKGTIKEIWNGFLEAGKSEIYVFTAQISTSSQKTSLCVRGELISSHLQEVNLENNEVCSSLPKNEMTVVTPYPNPIKDILTLKIISPKEEAIDISILDNVGKEIYRIKEQEVKKGLNTFYINTINWATGSYKIMVKGEDKIVVSVVK